MFYVIHWKKVRRLLIATLLFCLLTAIILKSSDQQAVSTAALEHTSAPVLIIDAGHGGLDGGAVAVDGTLESTINLVIAQKLEIMAQFFGVETVMTRVSETLDYPEELTTIREKKVWDQKRRIALINSVESGILISIHQNNYPDPRPSGPQVFYATVDGSDVLAELAHGVLTERLDKDNRRVAAPISERVYLMKHITCPGILVECGFLSNANEAALLASDNYESKLALVLLCAFGSYLAGR